MSTEALYYQTKHVSHSLTATLLACRKRLCSLTADNAFRQTSSWHDKWPNAMLTRASSQFPSTQVCAYCDESIAQLRQIRNIAQATSRPTSSAMCHRCSGRSWCVIFTSLTFSSCIQARVSLRQGALLYPAPYGALTQLFAGTMPEALNYNGEVRVSSVCVQSDPEGGRHTG